MSPFVKQCYCPFSSSLPLQEKERNVRERTVQKVADYLGNYFKNVWFYDTTKQLYGMIMQKTFISFRETNAAINRN